MEMNYSSKAVGNAGLATGIIGTALGVMNGGAGILGIHNTSGNQYVSKEAYDIQLQLINSERQNAILQADLDSEKKMVSVFESLNDKINNTKEDLQTQIRAVDSKLDANVASQSVINAQIGSQTNINTSQIAQLFGMTQLVIPNSSVMPGWGSVCVAPNGCSTCGTTIA